ncbi:MAG TPA: HU family DNA-binding protein [Pseudonocardiaceae bacterium]
MNKAQLIDALAERLGDKKIAAAAVAGLIDVVVRTVSGGGKVTITGFGVFEKRARAARMARNPRTGESVKVKKTNVPAFRPGLQFREIVSGVRKLPRVAGSINGAAAAPATTSRVTTSTALTSPSTTPTGQTPAERLAEVPTAAVKAETKTAIKTAKAAKAAKKQDKTATKTPAKITTKKLAKKSAAKK